LVTWGACLLHPWGLPVLKYGLSHGWIWIVVVCLPLQLVSIVIFTRASKVTSEAIHDGFCLLLPRSLGSIIDCADIMVGL